MEWGAKRRRTGGNDGTAGGASSTHTSTEGQEVTTSSGYDYEVFLSFRGPDTRAGFTDFLYTSLKGAGIRTFKDDEDLRKGVEFAPELLQAIKQSKILIPIFSKDYASSVWCLKEVVQMVECKKTEGKKIMPIFYDVAPSEVRHQIGNYEKSFLLLESKERYDQKTIGEWKDALRAVGEINGWELPRDPTRRREGKFVKKFTQKIFNELKKASLVVSNNLVGVDHHVDEIMNMIGAQTSETRIIGIHGMGGIGKTTIAKIIYNQLSSNFEDCCFLSNIRETSKRNGVECLQKQLISDILRMKETNITNVDEGTQKIQDRFSDKRVLLLLDDVETESHIDALVGKRDWFGKGSKIIITTRNKNVLCVPKVDHKFELKCMDCDQSLQLFSKHAFRRDSPLDEYINQSNRAIRIAGGLPLALEVIGSLLGSTEKKKWDLMLKKLENVPHERVRSKLKISYDALDVRQQHIFLDIACFFIGYDKDILVHFWDESKYPEEAMEVLENMSLIKFEEWMHDQLGDLERTNIEWMHDQLGDLERTNIVWMHDQLRDLGREIVYQESNTKIKEQSRVWNPKEGLDLLLKHKGEKKVEALRLNLDYHQQYNFSYEGFKNLSHLTFLEVGGWMKNFHAEDKLLWHESPSNVLPTNENSDLLPQLRWLSWCDIPPTFNITNFFMEDVVILNLSRSKITDDWNGWSHMKVMKNLKVLNMSECLSLERLPDSIGNLESLIEFDISGTLIKELPDSVGNLKKLKVVNMQDSGIRKIPNVLWSMRNLEDIKASTKALALNGIFYVQIGNGIHGSQSLRILILKYAEIHALPRLPESLVNLQMSILRMDTFPDLSNLTNLKTMDLDFGRHRHGVISNGLGEHPMPRWLGNLSKLEFLALRFRHGTTSPTDLTLPPQLKSLHIVCPNLRHLPGLPSSLSSLELEDCKSLCSMEDLSNLKKLSYLHINFAAVAEIQGLGRLENLQDLALHKLGQVKILPDLRDLNKLTYLQVGDCDELVEIQGQLPRFLHFFCLRCCGSLQKLPDLSSLMGMQLMLYGCKKLNMEAILGAVRLNPQHFKFSGFEQLQILPNLSNSNELKSLEVFLCANLVEIQGELPQSLEVLNISSCKSLHKLPNLSSSTRLREVSIGLCNDLVKIQGELPQSLEKLSIWFCRSLQKLPHLSSLIGLREFSIRTCDDLVEIPGELPQFLKVLDIYECNGLVEIQGELPQSLEKLHIFYCVSLQKLPYLSSLTRLREVCISHCNGLVEIQAELPQSLEKLHIFYCVSLQKLPYLSSLIGLREVCIQNCDNLIEIPGELPQSLEVLQIDSSCISLHKFTNLSSLMRLREVFICRCDDLVEIPAKLPQCLEKLCISSSKSLQRLPCLASLIGLRNLFICKCRDLVEILGELPQHLETLHISHCNSLQKLPYLSSSMGLQRVEILYCDKLVGIQGELPQHLKTLQISHCNSLQKLPYLSSSMGLRKVNIRDCDNLIEIQGKLPQSLKDFNIRDCDNLIEIQGKLPQSLKDLRFHSCKSLQKLPCLSSLMEPREFYVGHCNNLVEIQGELPQSLEKLVISYCVSLEKLPYLSSLIELQVFSIKNCDNLVKIPGELPQFLKVLDIYECQSLLELPNLSSLKGLQTVKIIRCGKLNVEAISSLCLEMSVKFVEIDDDDSEEDVEVDDEYDSEEDVEVDDEYDS